MNNIVSIYDYRTINARYKRSRRRVINKKVYKNNIYSKRMILLTFSLLFLFLLILFMLFSNPANAKEDNTIQYKYFKILTIEDGDTLWSLADNNGYNNCHNAFVKEVMEINHMSNSKIIEGQWIVVPYFSSEYIK